MKKIWGMIGSALWWPLWPAWWLYFKLNNQRSRVLVVCGDEVLLIRGWLSDKRYSVPGGGIKKSEKHTAGAVRELNEETGIIVSESALVSMGKRTIHDNGIGYTGCFFSVNLNEKPTLTIPHHEIFDATWVNFTDIKNFNLNQDAASALKLYRPQEQGSLL